MVYARGCCLLPEQKLGQELISSFSLRRVQYHRLISEAGQTILQEAPGHRNDILFSGARGITTIHDAVVRFTIMLVAAPLEHLGLVLTWAVTAHLRRNGPNPAKKFTFKTLRDWICHGLEEELRRRWNLKTNAIGVPHHRQRPQADKGQSTACPVASERQFGRYRRNPGNVSVRGGELELAKFTSR